MKLIVTLLLTTASIAGFSQNKIVGKFKNHISSPSLTVTFNPDSTFIYQSTSSPNSYDLSAFQEKGTWKMNADTIILNPGLAKKSFGSQELLEEQTNDETKIQLTFNYIKKYFNYNGRLTRTDTSRIKQLDFALNQNSRKNRLRVIETPTTRCAFAGFIPKEIITSERSVKVERTTEALKRIYVGCYELKGTQEFEIKNPNSNKLTINISTNIYEDGQIRQVKFLFRDEKTLFIKQKTNGKFQKDGLYIEELVIKKEKDLIVAK